MDISILTFEGFNEIDSFMALNILSRVDEFNVQITSPSESVTSMNGVTVHSQQALEYANNSDVVLIGSGVKTKDVVVNSNLLSRLAINPRKQLVGSQCSGAILLHAMGLLNGLPVCTDRKSATTLTEQGVTVLTEPFYSNGNIASAGGCLSSIYLSAWVIVKMLGIKKAEEAIRYIAPIKEQESTVNRCISVLSKYVKNA